MKRVYLVKATLSVVVEATNSIEAADILTKEIQSLKEMSKHINSYAISVDGASIIMSGKGDE